MGIAVDEHHILEAAKKTDARADSQHQVRVVHVSQFVAGKSRVLHCIRPEILSSAQITKLRGFADSSQGNRYTALHAALTVVPLWMKYAFILLAAFSMADFWRTAPWALSSFVSAAGIVTGIGLFYALHAWSFQCEWGAKATENLYRKFSWGHWLVERKYEFFCSKLVLLADRAIGGPLAIHLPGEHEVLPRHFIPACKRLKWLVVDYLPPSTAPSEERRR